jgi:hypothetical protein
MGQNQLLLIVLGIIVVGISIGIANQLFDTSAESSNRDSIAYELVNLGTLAQQYYNRPNQMGGGGKSFAGWGIPANIDTTISGYYNVLSVTDEVIIIEGYPFPEKKYNWHLQSTISQTNIITETRN